VSEHTSARVALTLDGLGLKGVKALVGGYRQWLADGNAKVEGQSPK
jgi:3-mercaptopyruvate sulfurtransferase SseA